MSEQITVSSVDELLLADDQQFVQLAYRTVLKREPDPPGNAAYLSHLRRGVDRRRLIANMALSAEGRLKESNLPGLADLVKRYKLSPLERLGARIRRFLFGSNESVEQAVHALKIDFMRQRNEAREQMDRIERHLQTLSSEQRIGYGRLLQQMEESSAHATASSELPEAATSGRRIVFNLSTSKHWRARPVGIVRVERELASYFAKSSNAVFVFWDAGRKAFMRLSTREVSEILSDKWTDRTRSVADVGDLSLPIALNENDTFISVGLDWDLSPLQSIAKVLIPSGCRNVFACHDLVPIKFPEFCVEEHFDQKFKQHFVNMAHLADSVFAVSSNSMRDLERFWDQAEMEAPLPEIRTVKLANLHRPDRLPRLSPVDTERLRHVRAGGSYVLYVSSIEARKIIDYSSTYGATCTKSAERIAPSFY